MPKARQHPRQEPGHLDLAGPDLSDVAEDDRWLRWSAVVGDLGLRAVVAIRLHTGRETLGALNLYAQTRGAFDDEAVDIALIFAVHATDAMSKAHLVTGLQAALESRHTIGIAQGVLAVRYGIYLKLRDVAARVAEDRDLPVDAAVRGGDLDPV